MTIDNMPQDLQEAFRNELNQSCWSPRIVPAIATEGSYTQRRIHPDRFVHKLIDVFKQNTYAQYDHDFVKVAFSLLNFDECRLVCMRIAKSTDDHALAENAPFYNVELMQSLIESRMESVTKQQALKILSALHLSMPKAHPLTRAVAQIFAKIQPVDAVTLASASQTPSQKKKVRFIEQEQAKWQKQFDQAKEQDERDEQILENASLNASFYINMMAQTTNLVTAVILLLAGAAAIALCVAGVLTTGGMALAGAGAAVAGAGLLGGGLYYFSHRFFSETSSSSHEENNRVEFEMTI